MWSKINELSRQSLSQMQIALKLGISRDTVRRYSPRRLYTRSSKACSTMFSLGDGTRFWLDSKPTDMRNGFNMQGGIVNNATGHNLYSGDVFVFVNASNNMMKLLRYEPGGLVIYNKHLYHGRMLTDCRGTEKDART